MAQRLFNAIGLSMKAGKCISGDFAVEKALKSGKLKLVLLDESASDNTKQRYQGMCDSRNVPLLAVEQLGNAIGKSARIVAGISDNNFTKMILDAHAAENAAASVNAGV